MLSLALVLPCILRITNTWEWLLERPVKVGIRYPCLSADPEPAERFVGTEEWRAHLDQASAHLNELMPKVMGLRISKLDWGCDRQFLLVPEPPQKSPIKCLRILAKTNSHSFSLYHHLLPHTHSCSHPGNETGGLSVGTDGFTASIDRCLERSEKGPLKIPGRREQTWEWWSCR